MYQLVKPPEWNQWNKHFSGIKFNTENSKSKRPHMLLQWGVSSKIFIKPFSLPERGDKNNYDIVLKCLMSI